MGVWIALPMFMLGIILAAVSYLFLATPLGPPVSPEYSNPRMLGAPAIFILGVVLIFLSAVVYELAPEKEPAAGEVEAPREAPRMGFEPFPRSRN